MITKNAKLKLAEQHLCQADKIMHGMIKKNSPLSIKKTAPSYFHALIQTIINQQLSVKAAATIEKRVLKNQGGRIFNADRINNLKTEPLSQCGLSNNKIRYVKTLAKAVVKKELNFRKLISQDDESIRNHLIAYPGIGQWSADIFLMNGLGREDIFPVGDLIIRKSIQHHYSIPSDAHYDEYFIIAEKWRPYRTIACYYLWKAFHQKQS